MLRLPHSRQTFLKLLGYLLVFVPLKILFEIFGRVYDLVLALFWFCADQVTSHVNGETVQIRKILWRCVLRPVVLQHGVAEESLHLGWGRTRVWNYILERDDVFLHFMDEKRVIFVRLEEGRWCFFLGGGRDGLGCANDCF